MTIKSVLLKKYNCWAELEREIEKIEDTTEKGDAFEQFCYYYFVFHKALYQIEEVYSPKIEGREIPKEIEEKLKLSHKDDGVDGVFITIDGKYTAYQAKFRSCRRSPASNELNNFWAEAEYADNRLVIANCASLPRDTGKRKCGSSVLVDKFDLLSNDFFDFLFNAVTSGCLENTREKLSPKDFQIPIIKAAVDGLNTVDKGKIIAACATGKTLISLWISEKINAETVLFFAPNLSLIRQSIERWTENANINFQYLAVCSDVTVSSKIEDDLLIEAIDLDVPVTTDADSIIKFLVNVSGKRVIFSTYQSVECIIETIRRIPGFTFDLAIYDEAHRTAGKSDNGLFNLALKDSNIPVKKRLFMTATERLVKPWIKDKLEQEEITVFSMDDESIYGPTFYKFTFGEAIKQKIISDYKIVVAGITNEDVKSLIQTNRYLNVHTTSGEQISGVSADTLFKAFLLGKAIKTTGMKKVVSFHSSVAAAKEFVKIYTDFDCKFMSDQFGIDKRTSAFLHVNGGQATSERSQAFRIFQNSEFGLLSNVRCLTEGVDMPFIDGIMFADSKGSMIDIVQAVGRALRKPQNVSDKTAYIVIPIRFNEDGSYVEDDFAPLHFVIQALRDQDDTLAEWIDEINLGVVKGKSGHALRRKTSKVKLLLPKNIDADKFADELTVKIATVNAKATGEVGLGSTLGKNQRGSEYKRIFKSIGDYNREKFKESLVDPTIDRYSDQNSVLKRTEIIVNNNNVSHCARLGVITKIGANNFELTDLGKKYKRGEISFDELFMNQILVYTLDEGNQKLFPYRVMLAVLSQVKTMNYIEFLYSVYSAQANNEGEEIDRAVGMINYIRDKYPNVMMTSTGNQDAVRADLNEKHGMGFSERDVWTDRTTAGNQYRFMINHMLLFKNYLDIDLKSKTIRVKEHKEEEINQLLEKTESIYRAKDFKYGSTFWLRKGDM